MDDEQLRKEKYRCEYDGADGITIGDLFFKAANPTYNRRVQLKKGEYVLTELLDFTDLKKSRTSGALAKFIEMGWVVVESPLAIVERKIQTMERRPDVSSAITEIQTGILKGTTNLVATGKVASIGFPSETQPKIVESLSIDKSRNINSLAISEVDAASASVAEEYEKFDSLRYFQKLKTIKDTRNVNLLELIVSKSHYPQLVHNSKNRLRDLQTSR